MMKKVVFIAIAVAMVMTGCNRQSAQDENDVRLTLRAVWNIGYKVPDDQYNNPVAAAIREKTGVTVTYETIMMSEVENLNLMFASGDMPDIVNAPFWGGIDAQTLILKKAAAQGLLHPIQDMLEKYPNVKRAYDVGVVSLNYLEQDLMDPAFDGNIYFIPQQTPGSVENITNWAYGVFVRGDVPEALGIDPSSVKTHEDLYNFMVKARDHGFRDANGNAVITATTLQNGWHLAGYGDNFGTRQLTSFVKNPDGTVTHTWLTENYIDANLFNWRLVNEGILDKECFRHTASQANAKVGNGSALFFSSQYLAGINATKETGLYNAHPEMRYVPVGPMTYADGSPLVWIETMGRTGSPVIFFPKTNKNLDASFRYIDFINTIEGLTLADYGVEGLTWNRNEDGQPRLVQSLLDRKARGDTGWEDTLREAGGGYIGNHIFYGSLKQEWFGEESPGNADSAIQELEDYKKMRPVMQLPGYPLSALQTEFPDWEKVRVLAYEGDIERTYRERAYFAPTEAEARNILREFQNYLRTQQDGVFMDWLEFMTEKANSRPDIAF